MKRIRFLIPKRTSTPRPFYIAVLSPGSASNYKTDAWLKIKTLLAVVAIYVDKHHQQQNTTLNRFARHYNWFTSTRLVLKALIVTAGAFDLLTSVSIR